MNKRYVMYLKTNFEKKYYVKVATAKTYLSGTVRS